MFTDLTPRAKAATFYLLALGQCIVLSALMRSAGEIVAVLAMFTPFTALLIMQFAVTRDGYQRTGWGSLGVTPLGLRFWPLAVLMPIAVLAGSESVVGLTGLTVAHPSALPSIPEAAFELVVLSGFAFFEEIGWRGYFLPLLSTRRPGTASFAVGLLHGIYHLPVVFLVPGAYLTEGNRWITVPMFLAVMSTAGGLYGWLRLHSGSVWTAVIAHGAVNLGLDVIENGWTPTSGTVALIGRETGVATLGFLLLAAVVLYARPAPSPRGATTRGLSVPA